MRKGFLIKCGVWLAAAALALTPINASAATLLKLGSRGYEVKAVQTELKELGYFTYSRATGYYGSITKNAVKRFQRANGLYADGIVGKKTIGALKSRINNSKKVSTIAVVSGSAITLSSTQSSKTAGSFDWFGKVRSLWKRGKTAVVTDVDTGLSFKVKRTYGTNHADVEPLTKKDTEVIKKIWGGFSWERRAVTVEIGDYLIAGSMTAMPHAGVDSVSANRYVRNRSAGYGYGVNLDAVKNNGCSGVMDIHFKNSRTHSTNVVQKIQQDMIRKAAIFLSNL